LTLAALKKAQIVAATVTHAKVFLSGKLNRAVTLKGVLATKGAASAIVQAGGKVRTDGSWQRACAGRTGSAGR